MLLDYARRELADGSRTVVDTDHWLAVVPYWAAWPFETLLLPKAPVQRITDLTDAQRSDLALALKKLTSRYDNLFQCSFPTPWAGTARRLTMKTITTGSFTPTFIRRCCAPRRSASLWLATKCWPKRSAISPPSKLPNDCAPSATSIFVNPECNDESERENPNPVC